MSAISVLLPPLSPLPSPARSEMRFASERDVVLDRITALNRHRLEQISPRQRGSAAPGAHPIRTDLIGRVEENAILDRLTSRNFDLFELVRLLHPEIWHYGQPMSLFTARLREFLQESRPNIVCLTYICLWVRAGTFRAETHYFNRAEANGFHQTEDHTVRHPLSPAEIREYEVFTKATHAAGAYLGRWRMAREYEEALRMEYRAHARIHGEILAVLLNNELPLVEKQSRIAQLRESMKDD